MAEKIIARFIIEIAGKPVENVSKALNLVLDKIKEEKDKFKLLDSHIGTPELDSKTTLYAGFLDLEIRFKEASELMGFVLDYTPTSIEIVEPEILEIDANSFGEILNHMSSSILASLSQVRNLNAQIHFLNTKLNEKK